MAITKLSDLKIGNSYFVYWFSGSPCRHIVFFGCVNEYDTHTEIYVGHKERKGFQSYIYLACEIGIGESRKEAIANYKKFKYENNPLFFKKSDDALIEFEKYCNSFV